MSYETKHVLCLYIEISAAVRVLSVLPIGASRKSYVTLIYTTLR